MKSGNDGGVASGVGSAVCLTSVWERQAMYRRWLWTRWSVTPPTLPLSVHYPQRCLSLCVCSIVGWIMRRRDCDICQADTALDCDAWVMWWQLTLSATAPRWRREASCEPAAYRSNEKGIRWSANLCHGGKNSVKIPGSGSCVTWISTKIERFDTCETSHPVKKIHKNSLTAFWVINKIHSVSSILRW